MYTKMGVNIVEPWSGRFIQIARLGEVLDAGYIPVKVNGNADESVRFRGQEFSSRAWAQQQGIYVFPGTLILDPEGNQLKRRTGFMNTDELRQFLYR